MSDFVKQNDLEFIVQLEELRQNLPTYLLILGLLPADQTQANDMAAGMSYIALRNANVPGYAQGWTKLRDQVRFGIGGNVLQPFPAPPDVSTPPATILIDIEGKYRTLAGRIKAADGYTPGIGESLGIEAPKTLPDYSTYKPVFTLELAAGQVLIKWKKLQSQGVNVYKKIDAGPWFKLEFDGTPNYLDKSALPPTGVTQQWSYRLRYVKADEEIGEFSIDMTIKVSGL